MGAGEGVATGLESTGGNIRGYRTLCTSKRHTRCETVRLYFLCSFSLQIVKRSFLRCLVSLSLFPLIHVFLLMLRIIQ